VNAVSVIVPCHNAAEWIGDALHSIAGQTVPANQVIVIDDASSDNSLDIVKDCGLATDVLQVKCGNAAATRNAGLQVAKGDWVAFLDADNIWYRWHLENSICLLDASGDVACMSYPGESSGAPTGPAQAKGVPYEQPASGLNHHEFVRLRLQAGYGFPTTGQVVRTERLREVGGFDESQRRRHDFEFFMRIIHGRTWSFQPMASWWSRPPRPGNISSNHAACKLFALRALELNRERYAGQDMDALVKREARAAYKEALQSGTGEDCSKARLAARKYLGPLELSLVGLKSRLVRGSKRTAEGHGEPS